MARLERLPKRQRRQRGLAASILKSQHVKSKKGRCTRWDAFDFTGASRGTCTTARARSYLIELLLASATGSGQGSRGLPCVWSGLITYSFLVLIAFAPRCSPMRLPNSGQ